MLNTGGGTNVKLSLFGQVKKKKGTAGLLFFFFSFKQEKLNGGGHADNPPHAV